MFSLSKLLSFKIKCRYICSYIENEAIFQLKVLESEFQGRKGISLIMEQKLE